MDWRQFFPLKEPRAEQGRALDALCTAVESGKRKMVAELGTGVGKSAIAVTMSRWMAAREQLHEGFSKGAVVLTSQKILQDQYLRDFPWAKDVRSAANFRCTGLLGESCAETIRVRKAIGKEAARNYFCGECPYRACKNAFMEAELGVTNYSYFLSETMYAGELKPRQLLVLDEAHNVEAELRRWATVEVSEDDPDLKRFKLEIPFEASHDEAVEWLEKELQAAIIRRLGKIGARLQELLDALKFRSVSNLANENDRLDKWKCRINRLLPSPGKIIFSSHEGRDGKRSVRFQPTEVGKIAEDLIYRRSSACLMMSATIIDFSLFSDSIGLKDAAFVSIPTPFKRESFGIRYQPLGKMSQSTIEHTLQKLPRKIEEILEKHPNEKGIIHAVSYRVAQEIARVDNPRLLIQRGGADREQIIQRHISDPGPTVLVSPAMMEGLDLRDDLGRFQVICKVPFPSMGDPVVKGKSWDWQIWQAIKSLVQAAGRCVRNEQDWAHTYILDECYQLLLRSTMLPAHLRPEGDWKAGMSRWRSRF